MHGSEAEAGRTDDLLGRVPGILSRTDAASPKALNCSGFRNITEQPEQA